MRVIVGITGASGAVYGVKLLEAMRGMDEVETHLIISKAARITIAKEINYSIREIVALADHYHNNDNIAAIIASGSYVVDAMIVAPCSAKTLAEIAVGITPNLISRSAEVVLKERKRLILMLRETPLHLTHIQNMMRVTEMGGIIAPPVPAFYNKPSTLEDIIDYTIVRILDLIGIHITTNKRWQA